VTITVVCPSSSAAARSICSTSRAVPLSNAPVGSSASSTAGCVTRARDGDSLLLSARQGRRQVLGSLFEPYPV
jgi:hypothetical protein